jgi:hypothetical protein
MKAGTSTLRSVLRPTARGTPPGSPARARTALDLPDLPIVPRLPSGPLHRPALALDRALRRCNSVDNGYRDLRPETRTFLKSLFARENAGLSELIGIDVGQYWPYM